MDDEHGDRTLGGRPLDLGPASVVCWRVLANSVSDA